MITFRTLVLTETCKFAPIAAAHLAAQTAIDITFPRQPRVRPFGTVEVMTDRAGQYPRGSALTLAELREDPHPALARLRETEPVPGCRC